MSFIEQRLREAIVYGTTGGPSFKTQINSSPSGVEQRNADWSRPLGKWELGERKFVQEQMEELNEFFLMCQGKAIGFRFKDWTDYKTTRANGRLVDGAPGTFQLAKSYGDTTQRLIKKPVAGTVKVYNSEGVLLTTAIVNPTSGIVTGAGVGTSCTWEGEFDVPVRFDVDEFRARMDAYNKNTGQGIWLVSTLPLKELRQP
jgi:uncharacterized protein (TIGR02217 family)